MNEEFDDMIRRQLEDQESAVPDDFFDRLRQQPAIQDALFDGAIRQQLQPLQSAVPPGLFDAIAVKADLDNFPFDAAINEKLSHAESEVPADMWQRIMQEKKRRRPVVFWWWAAAGLLLMLVAAYYSFLSPSQSVRPPVVSTNSPATNSRETSVKKQQPAASRLGISHPDSVPPPEVLLPGAPESILKEVEEPLQITATQQPARSINRQQHNRTSTKPVTTVPPTVYASSNSAVTPSNTNKAAGNDIGNEGNYEENTTSQVFLNGNRSVLATTESLIKKLRLQPGQLLTARFRQPVLPCPVTDNTGSNNWYVDVYSSAMLLHKRITDNFMGKNAKAGFDSTLHRQVSYNVGVNLVKEVGKNLLVKTGLQYNRINEAFKLTRINERRLVTTLSIRTVVLAPGDTVIIRDTTVTEHIGTAVYRKQNTYTQWDIPLIIGYRFGGENMHLNVNAGIIANIRSSYKGEILDTMQKVSDINQVNGNAVYRKRTGISLYAGFSLIKPITTNTSLLVEPHIRFGLSGTSANTAWFTQKNTMWGVSIGLRYNLNTSRQRLY